MSWRDGATYDSSTVFTPAMVKDVTAQEFYRWCKFRVYGDPDADETITPPLYVRHNTVMADKKCCSFFMENQNLQWNETAQTGNPTRSAQMAKLLKHIKRMQTRKMGKASQARRSCTQGEYERIIQAYWAMENKEAGLCAAAVTALQMAFIARNDDVCKFVEEDLKRAESFPHYGVMGRLPWCKNVTEERDAPPQVMIGAMDPRYCPLLNLASWLEYNYGVNPTPNKFVFGLNDLECPVRIKTKIQGMFQELLRDGFVKDKEGNLGTHSIRKFAATFARGNGCSKASCCIHFVMLSFYLIINLRLYLYFCIQDDVDSRGRWKNSRRIVETYLDNCIPYIDAKVAAANCKGGAIAYCVNENSGISDDWILTHVVPNMYAYGIDKQVCIVLGRALLFRVFDASGAYLPPKMRDDILGAFNDLGDRNRMADGEMPILVSFCVCNFVFSSYKFSNILFLCIFRGSL